MATYIKIATVDVGAGGAANIDFTSIPSTYTDLCVKVSGRTATAGNADNLLVKFNTSSTSFTSKALRGSGSAVVSYSPGSANIFGFLPGATSTASTFGNTELYIPNYAGSTNKSYSGDSVTENNGTEAYALLVAGLWSNTSAISSITIYSDSSSNLTQYTTATLYGIKNS